MIAKKYRLPSNFFLRDRRTVLRKNESAFLLIKTYASEVPYRRFAVIVSKKSASSAVARSKIRRFIYERVRRAGGWALGREDVVVTVKRDFVNLLRFQPTEALTVCDRINETTG